ncbi:MAG: hypothetical protein JW866_10915 [Ignavibacteriales bacterium]|nr:hypothetical protein [Ignavibacteriales bacterium]
MSNVIQFRYNYYENTYKRILKHIIHSYRLISVNETIQYSEITNKRGYKTDYVVYGDTKEKPEEYIRNLFLSKKYLWNQKLKQQYRLKRLSFEPEPAEIDENNITIGYHDIKVIGLTNEFYETEKDLYFSIECKRLNKSSQDVEKYVNQGIKRFVIRQYSKKMPLAGMIAFIEEGNPLDYKDEINLKLEKSKEIMTKSYLEFLSLDNDFDFSYLSKHVKQNSDFTTITLYHLFFEIGHIIIKSA